MDSEIPKPCVNYEKLLADIDDVLADMKVRVRENLVVAQGTQTFLKRYKEMMTRGKFANATLGSALYRFGWVFGGKVRNTHGGYLRRGRRIPVSAKAAGRRHGHYQEAKQRHHLGDQKVQRVLAILHQSTFCKPGDHPKESGPTA